MITHLVGPLLVGAGFGLYMLANVWLGRFRRIPWEFIAVSAAGVLYALGHLFVRPALPAAISALVACGLFGLLLWFYFRFSMYGPREDRPAVGDRFPDVRLPASDGSVFDLAAERGKRHLFIFYRGSW